MDNVFTFVQQQKWRANSKNDQKQLRLGLQLMQPFYPPSKKIQTPSSASENANENPFPFSCVMSNRFLPLHTCPGLLPRLQHAYQSHPLAELLHFNGLFNTAVGQMANHIAKDLIVLDVRSAQYTYMFTMQMRGGILVREGMDSAWEGYLI